LGDSQTIEFWEESQLFYKISKLFSRSRKAYNPKRLAQH